MPKIMTRGPVIGQCNICGQHGKLTEDHIPPKGSIRIKAVEMFDIITMLGAEKLQKGRISQNGVKYRTLCASCNNERLGIHYDPEFNNFNNTVARYLKSSLILPDKIQIRGKPNRIARAIIGHLLAFELDGFTGDKTTTELQEYFLHEDKILPNDVNIYYWPYPYNDQVIIKDAAMIVDLFKGYLSFMLLKFFPMAYMVVLKTEKIAELRLACLNHYIPTGLDDEVDIPILLANTPRQRWPEAPDDDGAVMYGQRAMGAVPHKQKTRIKSKY